MHMGIKRKMRTEANGRPAYELGAGNLQKE